MALWTDGLMEERKLHEQDKNLKQFERREQRRRQVTPLMGVGYANIRSSYRVHVTDRFHSQLAQNGKGTFSLPAQNLLFVFFSAKFRLTF